MRGIPNDLVADKHRSGTDVLWSAIVVCGFFGPFVLFGLLSLLKRLRRTSSGDASSYTQAANHPPVGNPDAPVPDAQRNSGRGRAFGVTE